MDRGTWARVARCSHVLRSTIYVLILGFAVQAEPVWDEYGLKGSEQIGSATVYRFKDPTGAFAAFEWQRPADAHASKRAPLFAESANELLIVHGNYLLRFTAPPSDDDLQSIFKKLAKVDEGPLPFLSGALPAAGLVPNSERYVLGPESLAKFAPGVPLAAANFQLGAEAQAGRYKTKDGELHLVVFVYPTPQIARKLVGSFERLPGVTAKRTGPMIAVVLPPANTEQAQKLLSQVNYDAKITWDEYVPTRKDNIGVIVINCFILAGVLLGFCAVAGLALGTLKVFSRRILGLPDTPDPIITLGIGNK